MQGIRCVRGLLRKTSKLLNSKSSHFHQKVGWWQVKLFFIWFCVKYRCFVISRMLHISKLYVRMIKKSKYYRHVLQALLAFCATCGDSPEVKKTELSGNIPIFISYSWSECSVNCMFIVLSSMDVVGGATAAGVTLGSLYNYSLLYGRNPPAL